MSAFNNLIEQVALKEKLVKVQLKTDPAYSNLGTISKFQGYIGYILRENRTSSKVFLEQNGAVIIVPNKMIEPVQNKLSKVDLFKLAALRYLKEKRDIKQTDALTKLIINCNSIEYVESFCIDNGCTQNDIKNIYKLAFNSTINESVGPINSTNIENTGLDIIETLEKIFPQYPGVPTSTTFNDAAVHGLPAINSKIDYQLQRLVDLNNNAAKIINDNSRKFKPPTPAIAVTDINQLKTISLDQLKINFEGNSTATPPTAGILDVLSTYLKNIEALNSVDSDSKDTKPRSKLMHMLGAAVKLPFGIAPSEPFVSGKSKQNTSWANIKQPFINAFGRPEAKDDVNTQKNQYQIPENIQTIRKEIRKRNLGNIAATPKLLDIIKNEIDNTGDRNKIQEYKQDLSDAQTAAANQITNSQLLACYLNAVT